MPSVKRTEYCYSRPLSVRMYSSRNLEDKNYGQEVIYNDDINMNKNYDNIFTDNIGMKKS